MRKTATYQQTFFPHLTANFPSTRYQGSKAKIINWIWKQISHLDFNTCLDAFGGTGVVAYRLKQEGKQVTYNELLRFNFHIGVALIENSRIRISPEETDWLLQKHDDVKYPHFIQETFSDVYFTDEENEWIDQTITNIRQLTDPYKFAIAFFALCQSCIIKRPYNLFHRKNLYIRLAEVERSFGNKATWDKSFSKWFGIFIEEANQAIFDNGKMNRSINLDAIAVHGEYDFVYIDTPYISESGANVDYLSFYHFLEGLILYDEWKGHIDYKSKHRRLKLQPNRWTDKKQIYAAFDNLFQKYRKSIIVVSYRSDGIPSETELAAMLKQYKRNVSIKYFGSYKYVLSTNSESKEILLIGT